MPVHAVQVSRQLATQPAASPVPGWGAKPSTPSSQNTELQNGA